MTIENLLAFSAACLALAAIPGPDMIYLISRCLAQGPKAAFVSLGGITVAGAIHASAAAFGLSALFLMVPILYDVVRYAGAGYLLYLAWQALRLSSDQPMSQQRLVRLNYWALFRQGMLSNLLNPKAALFFIALFPQFLQAESPWPFYVQTAILWLILCVICDAYNAAIILITARIRRLGRTNPVWAKLRRWFLAGIFGGLAVRLVVSSR